MKIEQSGSVRIDLLGGTLDLEPINLILRDVVTLNIATSLKAVVKIEKTDFDGIEIESIDYNVKKQIPKSEMTKDNLLSGKFEALSFVLQIIDLFNLSNIKITLKSGSPAGAGLGGSSSMGVTLYSALCKYTNQTLNRLEAINKVRSIEGRILDCGPAGYQDYYPALFGGILALEAQVGEVKVHQLFTEEFSQFINSHLTLVYSGQTRHSGINNWEVYKGFYDDRDNTRKGLEEIALLSKNAFESIQNKNYEEFLENLKKEGEVRKKLFPGIVSSEMDSLYNNIRKDVSDLGMKVCGAGGGGCFILAHKAQEKDIVSKKVSELGMTVLDFEVDSPI